MNISWNAQDYTQNFSFVHEYGSDLISMIQGEHRSVLDLGCGNGALTHRLAQAGHRAEGLDASPELLELAKTTWPGLVFHLGNAVDFQAAAPFDVVFSNAVLHWIDETQQDGMLRCVNRALKPGGQFVFELGGYGNNALIHRALSAAFVRRGLAYRIPFYFPTVGQYSARLERAGFLVTYALLFDRPTPLRGPDGLYDWLRMFIQRPFQGMDPAEEESILRETVQELESALYREGVWYSDYVRLRCKAVKPTALA